MNTGRISRGATGLHLPTDGDHRGGASAGRYWAERLVARLFLLINFTIGRVSYQVRGPFRGVDPAVASRHGRLPSATFPASVAAVLATSLRDWDFDASFEFGASIILAGLDRFTR